MIFVIGIGLDYSAGAPMRSVDANPKSRFLQYYTRLHKSGLALYYGSDCDFYDWELKNAKASIVESCTAPGFKGTWFLWGDSHAQALSYGLKSIVPANTSLAQVATSGCPPSLSHIARPTPGNACNVSNDFARLRISQLRPGTLILAQRYNHELTNWDEIAHFAKNNGVERVFLIGPLPEWLPSLPQVVATNYWNNNTQMIDFGISHSVMSTDRILGDRYGNDRDLTFISVIAQLCKGNECRARLPGKEPYNLIALDYGHLTPEGSVFVAQHILAEHLVERAVIVEPSQKSTFELRDGQAQP
jgi:hypothetical protein